METEGSQEKEEPKPKAKVTQNPEVKIEKKVKEEDDSKKETVNLINAVSEQFGLATFDVKDMILSGTTKIGNSEWRPKDGDFNIEIDDIQGKEIEIISSPKSLKFTFDAADVNEYRTSSPE